MATVKACTGIHAEIHVVVTLKSNCSINECPLLIAAAVTVPQLNRSATSLVSTSQVDAQVRAVVIQTYWPDFLRTQVCVNERKCVTQDHCEDSWLHDEANHGET